MQCGIIERRAKKNRPPSRGTGVCTPFPRLTNAVVMAAIPSGDAMKPRARYVATHETSYRSLLPSSSQPLQTFHQVDCAAQNGCPKVAGFFEAFANRANRNCDGSSPGLTSSHRKGVDTVAPGCGPNRVGRGQGLAAPVLEKVQINLLLPPCWVSLQARGLRQFPVRQARDDLSKLTCLVVVATASQRHINVQAGFPGGFAVVCVAPALSRTF